MRLVNVASGEYEASALPSVTFLEYLDYVDD